MFAPNLFDLALALTLICFGSFKLNASVAKLVIAGSSSASRLAELNIYLLMDPQCSSALLLTCTIDCNIYFRCKTGNFITQPFRHLI